MTRPERLCRDIGKLSALACSWLRDARLCTIRLNFCGRRLTSGRRSHLDAILFSCSCESFVVGDHSFEIVAEVERRGDVDGIESPQNGRVETAFRFEHRCGDLGEADSVEQVRSSRVSLVRVATADFSGDFRCRPSLRLQPSRFTTQTHAMGVSKQSITRGGLLPIIGIASIAGGLSGTASASPIRDQPHDGLNASATSNISITQKPTLSTGPCVPPWLSLANEVAGDEETFTLRVIAAAPPCSPIEASAVIYRMPGNGIAWPQHLIEVQRFNISTAGVTEITFRRSCVATQFDVVTGDTPPTISPLGPLHGPLLFPLDLRTSQQSWGGSPSCTDPPDPVVPESPMVPLFAVVGAAAGLGVMAATRARSRS